MIFDPDLAFDATDSDETETGEYDGTVAESDYAAVEQGIFPALQWQAIKAQAAEERPKLAKAIGELNAKIETLRHEAEVNETLEDKYDSELAYFRMLQEKRVNPTPEDAKKITDLEEKSAKAAVAWQTAKNLWSQIESQREDLQAKLSAVAALDDVPDETMLSINFGDTGDIILNTFNARMASHAITQCRELTVNREDQVIPAAEKIINEHIPTVNLGPSCAIYGSSLAIVEEQKAVVARAIHEIEWYRKLDAAYLELYKHFLDRIENPYDRRGTYRPKTCEEIRQRIAEWRAKKAEEEAQKAKDLAEERKKFANRTSRRPS